LIVTLAARHKLPAVYFGRFMSTAGGLISYGPDLVDQHRRAAEYVDRILKGEKPADLPVQAPTRYELVINLATASRAVTTETPHWRKSRRGRIPGTPMALCKTPTVTLCLQRKSSPFCISRSGFMATDFVPAFPRA
jgi:hypothetical protein